MAVRDDLLREALAAVVGACPRLARECYWAETSAIALEELHHRESFDLDLHTVQGLVDVRPLLAELQRAFGPRLSLIQPPDPQGSGFSGVIQMGEEALTIQVMANFEDVPPEQLTPSTMVPGIRRVTLGKYLRDKLQCLVERAEARDLVDVMAALEHKASLKAAARRALATLDEVLLAERLLLWTDSALAQDLAAYPEVDPARASQARDLLLAWLRE